MLQIKQGTPQCQLFTNPVGAVSDQGDGPQGPPPPPPPLFLDQTETESMDPPLWSKPRYVATFLKPGKRHARAVQLSYKASVHDIFR